MSAFKVPVRPIAPKGEQRRPRRHDENHLDKVRKLPCLVCEDPNRTEAAHLRVGNLHYGKRPTGAGEKPDDRWTLPLCGDHHREQHARGDEIEWWKSKGINPFVVAALLFSHLSANDEAAAEVVCSVASMGGYGW